MYHVFIVINPQAGFGVYLLMIKLPSLLGMVHRDLKLENILLSKNPDDSSDNLYIKVITTSSGHLT